MSITKRRRQHKAWLEWKELEKADITKKTMFFSQPIVGRWQYLLKSDKGEISIVELTNNLRQNMTISFLMEKSGTFWEIYCLEGDLFEKVQRFETLDEAEAAAKRYLS